MIARSEIVAAARSFVGLPFQHQARDPQIGLDCRGLLFAIVAKVGIKPRHEHRDDYPRDPDPKELRAALESELELLPSTSDALPGDVFLIRFPRQLKDQATHCGVLADGPYERMLIHAYSRDYDGEVIEEPLRRWEDYLVDAFSFPGVIDG